MATRKDGAGDAPVYPNRFADAGWTERFIFEDEDLSAATFEAEVRLTPNASGAPLANLTCTFVSFAGGDSTVDISLAQPALKSLPWGEERDLDAPFHWDLQVNGEVWLAGLFVNVAGVTQP